MSVKHAHEGPMSYERAPQLLNPLRNLILSPKALVKRLDLRTDLQVLEVGPGPGYFSPEIARSIPSGKLVLVDIQQEMLDMARKRLEKKGIANVEYVQGDAVELPVPGASFDVVFLVDVLGEVPEPDRGRCLRELYRVLRPQGLLSITEQLCNPHLLSAPAVQKLAEEEGFRLERTYGFSKHYTINFRKP